MLESSSVDDAVARLRAAGGLAASGHMLIADGRGSVGLEFSSSTFEVIRMDELGRVLHTNHYCVPHESVDTEKTLEYLTDSPVRLKRVGRLADILAQEVEKKGMGPTEEEFASLFHDHENEPASICRHHEPPKTEGATLAQVVMELRRPSAVVRLGQPCRVLDTVELSF